MGGGKTQPTLTSPLPSAEAKPTRPSTQGIGAEDLYSPSLPKLEPNQSAAVTIFVTTIQSKHPTTSATLPSTSAVWQIQESDEQGAWVLRNNATKRILYARSDGDYCASMGGASDGKVWPDSKWRLVRATNTSAHSSAV